MLVWNPEKRPSAYELIWDPWLVAEDTFRPPSYHRNTMSESMGLISGSYIAKDGGKGGFQAAGASLHNPMSSHGPDNGAFEKASTEELVPRKVGEGSMAFMFESCYMIGISDWGMNKCHVAIFQVMTS